MNTWLMPHLALVQAVTSLMPSETRTRGEEARRPARRRRRSADRSSGAQLAAAACSASSRATRLRPFCLAL